MAVFKHRLQDLPAKIRIDVPVPSPGPGILNIIGIVIGVVGAGFIIFGPETIYYNRYSGMTLLQMMQAYPGPIASVGFLLVTLGSLWSGHEAKQRIEAVEQALYSQLAFTEEDIPAGKQLEFEADEAGFFLVSLVDYLPDDEATQADIHSDQPREPAMAEVRDSAQSRDGDRVSDRF